MFKCQTEMLMTIFQANAYPTKEELRRHAESLGISEQRLKDRFFYMRHRKKGELPISGGELINKTHTHTLTHTHTNTHTYTHTHTHTHTHTLTRTQTHMFMFIG